MLLVRQLTLFLASPGDCSAERDVVRRVVEELNDSLGKMHEVRVEVVGWDSHARPATGKDSQALINQQIANMKQHELFVGLLWNRFGTPTPRAGSGTQEEFDLAVKARGRRVSAKPEIMFYFNEAPANLTSQREIEQKSLVLKFKESLTQTLYWTFDGTAAFETLFRRHYGSWLIETIANLSQAESSRIQAGETSSPFLTLHDFHYYPEDAYGEPQKGPFYPKALRDSIETTLAFSVASSSLQPVYIQNVFVQILEATAFRQATFPVYERGGNGITPVIGWAELKATLGSYRVMTDVKRTVGKGLPPADFHIRAFCRDGQKFVIAIEVEWMNLNDQTRSYRHVFPKELTVEMPQVIDWEEVVRASGELKVFMSSWDAMFFLEDFQRVVPNAKLTILLPISKESDLPNVGTMASEETRRLWSESIVLAPAEALRPLAELTSSYGEIAEPDRMRHFILTADHLLIENESRNELAEIVEDTERINQATRLFDDLAQRFSPQK